jgi:hypothetical protein
MVPPLSRISPTASHRSSYSIYTYLALMPPVAAAAVANPTTLTGIAVNRTSTFFFMCLLYVVGAPRVGFEPTTVSLTGICTAVVLPGKVPGARQLTPDRTCRSFSRRR